MNESNLLQVFVYLTAAVIGVPLAKRLGLGSVLGYLVAGVVIGPHALKLVGQGGDVMHFAEFGVVMMLFLVGLELKPSVLWQLRRPILGLGGLQVLVTAAVIGGGAMALGVPWKVALAIGLILPSSSTAIVLQSLNEKRLLQSSGGQSAFSVLLFQDIAVIPILALFPLLGTEVVSDHHGPSRPGWLQALLVLGAVTGIIAAGRFLVKPAFRLLAETRLREAFTAAALFLIVGIALLMEVVGLSPALGTFLAGVVLAESEYRHELEGDIEPFKGLLLGLFFISVGAQIDFVYIGGHVPLVMGLVATVMATKLLVLYGLGRMFGLDRPARWLFAFALAQVGEFAFVLLSFGVSSRIFGQEVATPLTAVVALSMMITPLFFIVLERFVLPRVTDGGPGREQDTIEHGDKPVVIAGYGRVGQVVGRVLTANGIGATVLDLDPAMVDVLRRLEMNVHYGDASRLDLLEAAGCGKAKLFVLAIDEPEVSNQVAELVRRHYPNLHIVARARNRQHYYALKRLGIDDIYRETLGSSLEMTVSALRHLGYRAHTATRLTRLWRAHDEKSLAELGKLSGKGENAYFAAARAALADAERVMRSETESLKESSDAAWDNESLREEVLARTAAAEGKQPRQN